MIKEQTRTPILKKKRAMRVRKHLRGTALKPRLCVVKTNKHIHVQIIDDEAGRTLASASTHDAQMRDQNLGKKNKEAAKKLGEVIGAKAKDQKIERVIFDRGSHKYHGILQILADAAREYVTI